ncbi:GGDEF domain-containing protein [Aciditerrimonas ferrireducens]|uniref:GGDEF domain-containing protein n=1 Tax=Aciditerrimonas ferrireducens TaxID=667306 RepID=UPI0020056984|nr:GGDEF domain-containing protein [Aciditerrimonas ferrireducens]MCK4178124.1 GGDEF domain-containing protein [Aciditerrimonas ferrireducens]
MAPPEVSVVLQRWRAAWAGAEGREPAAPWPEAPAAVVVEALLAAMEGQADAAAQLDRAASVWVDTRLSPATLVEQFPVLRSTLTPPGACGSRVLDEALDRLAARAFHLAVDRATDAARRDPLTGLGNRRALEETAGALLARLARHDGRLTVALVDLDGLKQVNDRLGHMAGDRLLVEFADRLRAVLRASDHAFRVGGDEFVVLLPGATPEGADHVFRRLRQQGPACTRGLALVPDEAPDLETALRLADRRLYAAKTRGRAGEPASRGDDRDRQGA